MRHPKVQLETPRLILRPLRMEDAGRIEALAGASEVAATTLRIPHPYPSGAAEAFIQSFDEPDGRDLGFGMALREDDGVIGIIGLHLSLEHEHAELGYWVGVPFWGKGYCTEAAAEVIRHGFAELRLHRIYAHYFANNPASGRVMEKLGMRFEGTFRQHIKKWGSFVDLHCYGILRDEWESR